MADSSRPAISRLGVRPCSLYIWYKSRGRAAHRNIAGNRPGARVGLQTADAVMVDDLQNVRLLQTVHGLGTLIVVNENDLLAVQVQQVTAADDTAVLAVLIQNREIAVTHAGHNHFWRPQSAYLR